MVSNFSSNLLASFCPPGRREAKLHRKMSLHSPSRVPRFVHKQTRHKVDLPIAHRRGIRIAAPPPIAPHAPYTLVHPADGAADAELKCTACDSVGVYRQKKNGVPLSLLMLVVSL